MTKIKISQIEPFYNHPFKVTKDESFISLVDSIRINGLLVPIIVRRKDIITYELISGHRRLKAYEFLGYKEIECNVVEMDDDEAIIYMVDSNMYRDKLLPSEKGFSYKMKMDAMKHQGKKTSTQFVAKSRTADKVGKLFNDSRENVRRYIRLTKLIPELLNLIDNTVLYDKRTYLTMGVSIGVELSYLNNEEQRLVYEAIKYLDVTPSLGQAKIIKQYSSEKKLDYNKLEEIMCQKKGNQNERIFFNKKKIEDALPKEIVSRDKKYIELYIIKAIKQYKNRI